MAALWTPESTPPQVSEDASSTVKELVLGNGVTHIAFQAYKHLWKAQEPFAEFLVDLGEQYEEPGLTDVKWRKRFIKMGGALAFLAYHKTGYFQEISSDIVDKGTDQARLEGVPEAFIAKVSEDRELRSIVETVVEAHDFRASQEKAYHYISVSAGSYRFHMQNALLAA